MATLTSPSEIAREALRRLASERIPPTPDNYRALYLSIADATSKEHLPPAERLIAELVSGLPRDSEESERLASQCEKALQSGNWSLLGTLLADRRSVRTGTRPVATTDTQDRPATQILTPPPPFLTPEDTGIATLLELCAFLLETPVATSLGHCPALAADARALGHKTRNSTSREDIAALPALVRRFAMRIELATEDQQELTAGVIRLLQLVIDNIGELVIDDRWLSGQIETLRVILGQPLDVRAIDAAERRLRDVIIKQSSMKAGLIDAQRSLKNMLSEFVGHLASFAKDAGAYHDRIDSYSGRISRAEHVLELQDVIQEVLRETKTIQKTVQRTHGELQQARAQIEEAEERVATLESELAQASELVRHDPLTGTLNRRGLEEVFDREIARAKRKQAPLCVAVLDIDNFKQLNDALGHRAGDEALMHLTSVVRSALRARDTLARYGGEEFIVLLPETDLDEAEAIMVRVQRELTRRFFLHNNQRVLVTFSAGVTSIPVGEPRQSAIQRADQLMYQAKQRGKNRVTAG